MKKDAEHEKRNAGPHSQLNTDPVALGGFEDVKKVMFQSSGTSSRHAARGKCEHFRATDLSKSWPELKWVYVELLSSMDSAVTNCHNVNHVASWLRNSEPEDARAYMICMRQQAQLCFLPTFCSSIAPLLDGK